MKTANSYFLMWFLYPLAGLADSDSDFATFLFRNVKSDDDIMMRKIIRDHLKPPFDLQGNEFKEASKIALSFYLTTDKINFGRIYDSLLLPFGPPKNPKSFFIWIWEIFFEGEDYLLENHEEYKVIEDNNMPGHYSKKSKIDRLGRF